MAYFFPGVSAERLSPLQLRLVMENHARLQAKDDLHKRNMRGELSIEAVKRLIWNATGDENLADQTAAQYALDSTRANKQS